MIRRGFKRRAGSRLSSQRVFHNGVANSGLTQLVAKFLILRDRHFLKAHQHCRLRVFELLGERFQVFLFLLFRFHSWSLLTYLTYAASSIRTPGLIVAARFTFLTYLPFAVAGFAFTTASSRDLALSRILSASNDTAQS